MFRRAPFGHEPVAVTLGLCTAFGLLVWVSRALLLGPGYGSDPDAWRAIAAATRLLQTGQYLPSRPPGYPLPEFADALLIHLGWGSGTALSMVSALLSGLVGALSLKLYAPLGRERALPGAIALCFTPIVYIAGMGAMDYVWGLTFFMAASLAASRKALVPAAVLLGLAAASRPTYALGFLPVLALWLNGRWSRLLDRRSWPQVAILALVSGSIAAVFFIPVMFSLGPRAFVFPYTGWHLQDVVLNASVRLFGLIGIVAIGIGLSSAVRHAAPERPAPQTESLDAWAWALMATQGPLFAVHPDEAAYLIPGLLGLYWLLARRATVIALWTMGALLVASCFALSLGRDAQHHLTVRPAGLVLVERQVQDRRHCIARVIDHWMALHPLNDELLVVAENRPQLEIELPPPEAGRLLYTVHPDAAGVLQDTEGTRIPSGAHITVLDRASSLQAQEWLPQDSNWPELPTQDCR